MLIIQEVMMESEMLRDARNVLADTEALQLKYPDMFSLKFSVKQWKQIVDELESKEVE
jgi:hypothetical protein